MTIDKSRRAKTDLIEEARKKCVYSLPIFGDKIDTQEFFPLLSAEVK